MARSPLLAVIGAAIGFVAGGGAAPNTPGIGSGERPEVRSPSGADAPAPSGRPVDPIVASPLPPTSGTGVITGRPIAMLELNVLLPDGRPAGSALIMCRCSNTTSRLRWDSGRRSREQGLEVTRPGPSEVTLPE